MKAVILKHREWDKIFAQIKRDYAHSPATYLVRWRMKEDLGFTVREHENWSNNWDEDERGEVDWRDARSEIHLDFYSEPARTMFMLRYMARD